MKRWTALLLAVLLCFGSAAAESPDDEPEVQELEETAVLGTEGELQALSAEEPDQRATECFDLAVFEDTLWYFADGSVCCGTATGELTASLPLPELIALSGDASLPEDAPMSLYILSRGTGVTLCAVAHTDDGFTARALELALENGAITVRSAADWTAALDPFFAPEQGWLQVLMFSFGNRLCVEALDASFTQQIWTVDPETPGSEAKVAELPFFLYGGLLPLESELLLIRLAAEEEPLYEAVRLDPDSGAETLLSTFPLPAEDEPVRFAFDPETDTLFFTLGNAAYRCPCGPDGTPEAFAVFPEAPTYNSRGALTGGRYAVVSESGALMTLDRNAALSAQMLYLTNVDAASGMTEAAAAFNASHPEAFVSVEEGGEESEVLSALLSGSAAKDLYVLSANTGAWTAIRSRGYAADLDGSALLTELSAQLPPAVAARVLQDGHLKAFPVSAEASCPILNVNSLCALTGLTREELPTDWPGLLALIRRLADEGLITGAGNLAFSESFYTPYTFRQDLFAWILRDCLQWLELEGSSLSRLSDVLVPVLQAFDAIDFTRLGFLDEGSQDTAAGNQGWLMMMGQPEIAVLDMKPGEEFWPLSMEAGGPRVIPQSASILMINPYSANQEAALAFVESVWSSLDPLTKMTLNGSLNEPVVNQAYQSDLAYFRDMIVEYDAALAAQENEDDKAIIQAEKEELEAFMADYRENAQWSASEASIAAYRKLEPLMRPALPEFWSVDEEDVAVVQYLDGLISAEAFASELTSALEMARLEGE